jgi:hypothetical protein
MRCYIVNGVEPIQSGDPSVMLVDFGPLAFGELSQRVHRNQRIPNEHVLVAVGLPKTKDAHWETRRDTSCDFTTL